MTQEKDSNELTNLGVLQVPKTFLSDKTEKGCKSYLRQEEYSLEIEIYAIISRYYKKEMGSHQKR